MPVCEKCGHEVDGKSPVCMYCGAKLPETSLTQETKERLEKEGKEIHTAAGASTIKAIGAFLIILGILADVFCMMQIGSSDFETYKTFTIGGTICFLIGLALYSNG